MRATVALTQRQAAELLPLLESIGHGSVLLGQVRREDYTGSNADTSGRWVLTVGIVTNAQVEAMRAAYQKAPSKPGTARRPRHE